MRGKIAPGKAQAIRLRTTSLQFNRRQADPNPRLPLNYHCSAMVLQAPVVTLAAAPLIHATYGSTVVFAQAFCTRRHSEGFVIFSAVNRRLVLRARLVRERDYVPGAQGGVDRLSKCGCRDKREQTHDGQKPFHSNSPMFRLDLNLYVEWKSRSRPHRNGPPLLGHH